MCGIVGIISKEKFGIFKPDLDVFEQLLAVDQIRGRDGTGMMYMDGEGCVSYKDSSDAYFFMNTKEYEKHTSKALQKSKFIIGHNRFATSGGLDWKSSHPFVEGHIVGVHNGTLWPSYKSLLANVASDSQAIYIHMAKHGYKETLKNIPGAFALVWVDCNTQTIHLARNKERPLCLIETKKCWLISSEIGLGLWIARRNGLEVDRSFYIDTNKVYTFDAWDAQTFTEEEVEYYVPPYIKNNNDKKEEQSERKKFTKWLKDVSKGEEKRKVHVFGERIKFVPLHKKVSLPQTTNTSLVFDKAQEMWYLCGLIDDEPNSYVRVYSDKKVLEDMEKWDKISGIVQHHVEKGKKVFYTVAACQQVVVIKAPHNTQWDDYCECGLCGKSMKKSDDDAILHPTLGFVCGECNEQFGNTLRYAV